MFTDLIHHSSFDHERPFLAKESLANLTSLWKTVSIPFDAYYCSNSCHYCYPQNSDWPKRLWYDLTPSESDLQCAIEILSLKERQLVLAWPHSNGYVDNTIERIGFERQSLQVGMSLKLEAYLANDYELDVRLVMDKAMAKEWVRIFYQSFGYKISLEQINHTYCQVRYYLAYDGNTPVGTAIINKTLDICGIHGVGIVPEHRRRGFASMLMRRIVSLSRASGGTYAVLQASPMGQGLYTKMGFHDDYLLANYVYTGRKPSIL